MYRWQRKPSDYDYDEWRDNGGMHPIWSLEKDIARCKMFIGTYQAMAENHYNPRWRVIASNRVLRELLILEKLNETLIDKGYEQDGNS